jgi:hypothetical protein
MSKIVILNKADADKLISSIAQRGKKLDADIHQAACSALSHHGEHGDTSLINRLILAMPKSGRRSALVAWAVAFDPNLTTNSDKETKADQPLVHVKGTKLKLDLDKAMDEPFWEFAPEHAYVQFDLAAALARIVKQAEKALQTSEQDAALISPEKLAALRTLAGTPETAE